MRRGRLESRWIEAGGLSMHARSAGRVETAEGPILVLVHGLVISSRYMIPTAERLAADHTVFAPDLPGFGLSAKPRRVLDVPELADSLLAWMDAMGIERPVLVGNSLGCQILTDLAARHPERVERAVLAGPTMDRHARSAPRQIGRWLVDWTQERPSLAVEHLKDYYLAGLRRALHTFRHALNDPIERKLPHVHAPALVVRGSRDRIVPQRWAEEVAALLPRGRLEIIDGPHVVNYTAPDAFVGVIREFLAE